MYSTSITSLSFHIASLNTQSLRLGIHKCSINTKQTAISQNGQLCYVRNGYKTVSRKPEGTTWENWAYRKRSFPFAQHEDACECGGLDPLFLNRGIIRRRMIIFIFRLLFLKRMSHWCPFFRRPSGPPSRSERFWNSAMIYRSISPHETAGVKIIFEIYAQKYGVGYGLDVTHFK